MVLPQNSSDLIGADADHAQQNSDDYLHDHIALPLFLILIFAHTHTCLPSGILYHNCAFLAKIILPQLALSVHIKYN